MHVAVIGANGGIGRELLPRLVDAGHDPIGIVRDESQFEAVRERGGDPRLGDLEGESPARSTVQMQSCSRPAPAGIRRSSKRSAPIPECAALRCRISLDTTLGQQ